MGNAAAVVPIPDRCPLTGRPGCWAGDCHRWRPGDLGSHPDTGKPDAGTRGKERRWWDRLVDLWESL